MKIICDRKGWRYLQTDTAGPLVPHYYGQFRPRTVFRPTAHDHCDAPQPPEQLAWRGVQPRQVPNHLAEFAINSTAAAILLLIAECA